MDTARTADHRNILYNILLSTESWGMKEEEKGDVQSDGFPSSEGWLHFYSWDSLPHPPRVSGCVGLSCWALSMTCAQHGPQRAWDNYRFDWNVLDWIYSCYCWLAINQKLLCLPWDLLPLLFIRIYCSLVATFCFFCLLYCSLSNCWTWEHFDNSNAQAPGLASSQSIFAALVHWAGWNSTTFF